MIDRLCGWTESTLGKGLIAGTLILVGASHFGWFTGVSSMSLPVIGTVGNLMGIVAVVGGACLLTSCCLTGRDME